MSIDTDYSLLRKVLHEHRRPLERTWAAEFGVYSGTSLALIAEYMPVIGFDSFEGLPEDWREGFPKGTFDLLDDENLPPALPYMPNAMIVPGWFNDTLPRFPMPSLGLVHIDCDLYSSTVTVLDAITPHVGVGTILVFDEFRGYPGHEEHEMRAFAEWCEVHKRRIVVEPLADEEGPHAQAAAFIVAEKRVMR